MLSDYIVDDFNVLMGLHQHASVAAEPQILLK